MARTRRNAGKGSATAGRDGVRRRKSATRKTSAAASVKRKPARSAARKTKPSPSSEIVRLKMLLQAARLQQQASAEILRAVANAAGDAAGPLQLIAETTARLFGAASVSIQLAKGSEFTQEYRVGAIAERIVSAYPRSNIRVEIRIRDNGTGIPPEVKEKMFNPFFTTKPAGEGTGLGLSMSHDIIVKQHGGSIDVLTEPGAFTEFVVTLQRKGSGQKMPGETK